MTDRPLNPIEARFMQRLVDLLDEVSVTLDPVDYCDFLYAIDEQCTQRQESLSDDTVDQAVSRWTDTPVEEVRAERLSTEEAPRFLSFDEFNSLHDLRRACQAVLDHCDRTGFLQGVPGLLDQVRQAVAACPLPELDQPGGGA